MVMSADLVPSSDYSDFFENNANSISEQIQVRPVLLKRQKMQTKKEEHLSQASESKQQASTSHSVFKDEMPQQRKKSTMLMRNFGILRKLSSY